MVLGIMQPYLFPYIGYFQLVNAVDKFVFYDDVNFIKQGWINKNRILAGGKDLIFTVPLKNQSSFVTINRTEINQQLYTAWKEKFLKTLCHSYSRAPHFDTAYSIIQSVLDAEHFNIGSLAAHSVMSVSAYLGIGTMFVNSSSIYENADLHSTDRILDICKKEYADVYLNAIGGRELYDFEEFLSRGVQLKFIKTNPVVYPQFKAEFLPGLSIVDIMMFNEPEQIHGFLNYYETITQERQTQKN